MAEEEESKHSIECHLQRSVRYHKARERFFTFWLQMFSTLSLLGGSAVIVGILLDAPTWLYLTAGSVIALMQAIKAMLGLSRKAKLHYGFAIEFISLERFFQMGVIDLTSIQPEILNIEMREPPIKRYLDIICHNQVAISIGSNDIESLTFWQRTLANYLSGDNALQNNIVKT